MKVPSALKSAVRKDHVDSGVARGRCNRELLKYQHTDCRQHGDRVLVAFALAHGDLVFREGLNLERAAALLTDLPSILASADASEKRAIVYALIDRLWIDNRVIVGLAPREETAAIITAAVGSLGCVKEVPDGHQSPAFYLRV